MKRLLTLGLTFALAGSSGLAFAADSATPPHKPAIAKEAQGYREVVKRVLPAVVSIEAKHKAKVAPIKRPPSGQMPFEGMPGMPDEFKKFFEQMPKQPFPQPEPGPGHSMGSGFVVDPTGVILTNEHVVRGADEVEVIFQDGRKFIAKDIKRDAKTDLAVLKIDCPEPLPFLKFGDSEAMEVGDRVLAIGAPLGMKGTVTSGIISAKGRDIQMNMYEDFLQTDAAINPGNSGGPLVNLDGDVVGINSAIKSGTGGFQGIGLAISSKLATQVMDQLLKTGTVCRGYLGVQVQPLDVEVAARLGVTAKSGVIISKVGPGSPAEKCGLKDGDILTAIHGQAVRDPRQLQQVVAALPIGQTVELNITRDGTAQKLTMTVEKQPEVFGINAESASPAAPTALDKFGLKAVNLTAELAKELGFTGPTEGVVVTEVDADGPAAKAGLRKGMVIQKANQQPTKNVAELQKALDAGQLDKGILLQVRTSQGGTSYLLLKGATR
jgi:serine protease Do